MRELDKVQNMGEFDKSNMLEILMDFSSQYRKARCLAEKLVLPETYGQVRNIVVSGMGGSAIGGDLLRSLFSASCPVPIVVNRNYSVPGFVDEHTLFIAASYSGNTEETLAAFKAALGRRAKTMSLTSGGELEKLSRETGIPHFSVPVKGIQPRCAFGYLFTPMVVFLSKLGLIGDQSDDISEAADLISSAAQNLSPDVPAQNNRAKEIAQAAHGKLPVIYASQNYFDIVAMRWKGQFNENSKMMAFHNVIPEMNHNEIVGWGIPEDITRQSIMIILKDGEDFDRINRRMDITKSLMAKECAELKVKVIEAQGSSPLVKALYFIYLGDFASYYLAILNGVDPTPINRIAHFKAMLEKD